MITATWSKVGKGLYHADAQKVANEIMAIGDEATPQQIVDKAKDKGTELNKCFTWDDKDAADKWRLHQARNIVCCLVIKRTEDQVDKPEIRFFHKNEPGSGYKPATYIFTHADEHAKLLQAAYAELASFKKKYSNLQELSWLIEQIP